MWCSDCESIDQYFFDETRFFFFVPTLETIGKLERLFDSLDFNFKQHQSHCISVICDKSKIDVVLMAVFGELNGPEKGNTKITSTPGATELTFKDIGRILSADVFINRYKSIWVVNSIKQENYESWFQPIVDARKLKVMDSGIFAHEALFRIRDEAGTIIPPGYVFSGTHHSRVTV